MSTMLDLQTVYTTRRHYNCNNPPLCFIHQSRRVPDVGLQSTPCTCCTVYSVYLLYSLLRALAVQSTPCTCCTVYSVRLLYSLLRVPAVQSTPCTWRYSLLRVLLYIYSSTCTCVQSTPCICLQSTLCTCCTVYLRILDILFFRRSTIRQDGQNTGR